MLLDLKKHIRSVPDFPKKGILFYDIGTLLAHGPAWSQTIAQMEELIGAAQPDILLAIEARGFLVAAPLAERLGIGLAMARKKGKLPGETQAHTYALEYGADTIEVQKGIIPQGARVLIVDDVLATGGTALAAATLARQVGGLVIGAAFLLELTFLGGRAKLDVPVMSLLSYDS